MPDTAEIPVFESPILKTGAHPKSQQRQHTNLVQKSDAHSPTLIYKLQNRKPLLSLPERTAYYYARRNKNVDKSSRRKSNTLINTYA